MKKKTRRSLSSALERLYIDSHLHFNDMIADTTEIDRFVDEHMEDFMQVTRRFVAERIS